MALPPLDRSGTPVDRDLPRCVDCRGNGQWGTMGSRLFFYTDGRLRCSPCETKRLEREDAAYAARGQASG